MNASITIIKEQKEFENVWGLINNTFDVKQTFPNQVFKKPFTGFVFEEFDWTITPEFWDTVIKQLAHISQDDEVVVAVLDPDPISYFHRNFGYYSMIKCSINTTTGDDYWDALEAGPPKSPADAMLFNSETMVWIPSSAKWAVWGERSYEICVLAFADDSVKQAAKPLLQTWYPADQALSAYIAQRVPGQFLDTLIKNYST